MDASDIIPMAMDIDSSGESDDDAKRESLTSEYQDVGQEARDGFFDLTDDEDWEYDADSGKFDDPFLSLEEIEEALEDAIGPESDLEMWNLRK